MKNILIKIYEWLNDWKQTHRFMLTAVMLFLLSATFFAHTKGEIYGSVAISVVALGFIFATKSNK